MFGLQGFVANEERIEVDYNLSTREVFLLALRGIPKAGIFDIDGRPTSCIFETRVSEASRRDATEIGTGGWVHGCGNW